MGKKKGMMFQPGNPFHFLKIALIFLNGNLNIFIEKVLISGFYYWGKEATFSLNCVNFCFGEILLFAQALTPLVFLPCPMVEMHG